MVKVARNRLTPQPRRSPLRLPPRPPFTQGGHRCYLSLPCVRGGQSRPRRDRRGRRGRPVRLSPQNGTRPAHRRSGDADGRPEQTHISATSIPPAASPRPPFTQGGHRCCLSLPCVRGGQSRLRRDRRGRRGRPVRLSPQNSTRPVHAVGNVSSFAPTRLVIGLLTCMVCFRTYPIEERYPWMNKKPKQHPLPGRQHPPR